VNFTNQKVLVVGLARSGLAAVRELVRLKAAVTATDLKPADQLPLNQIAGLPVELVLGGYPESVTGFDLVVTSPGVPLTAPPLKNAVKQGIPVWSELELAYRLMAGEIVAITGTNGKTTTTALAGNIFQKAGRPTVVAGNIGVPLVAEASKTTSEHISVVEVSSFQLEHIHRFRPRVAVILNLAPDHLDRHGTLENYRAVKARIFANQGPEDFTIINEEDPLLQGLAKKTAGRVLFFSSKHKLNSGVGVDNGLIVANLFGREEIICPVEDLFIPGPHNLENALAATAAALALGIDWRSVAQTLREFPGVSHRLERVAEINGVLYVNDSKGTNPDSTIKALASYDRGIVLIAGGRNKGNSFAELAREIKARVKGLVLVGEAKEEIRREMEKLGFANLVQVETFDEVVPRAARLAEPGDVVLLSPACASWDMFQNYEERGEAFKKQVEELAKSLPD